MTDFALVLSTVPDEETGRFLARKIVEERLAACVSLSSPVHSFYWWEGKITEDKERILVIKTKVSLFQKISLLLENEHPYDVPEIIILPLTGGYPPYLEWLEKETL